MKDRKNQFIFLKNYKFAPIWGIKQFVVSKKTKKNKFPNIYVFKKKLIMRSFKHSQFSILLKQKT